MKSRDQLSTWRWTLYDSQRELLAAVVFQP